MPPKKETPAQDLARKELPSIARRLSAALGNIYTTPYEGRLFAAYLRQHIFTHLERSFLPVPIRTQDALSHAAWKLVGAFFTDGRARNLGWSLPADPSTVWNDLHGLMMGSLVLPARSGEWRGEWIEVLRQAAERVGMEGRDRSRRASLSELEPRGRGGEVTARRLSLPEPLKGGRERLELQAPELHTKVSKMDSEAESMLAREKRKRAHRQEAVRPDGPGGEAGTTRREPLWQTIKRRGEEVSSVIRRETTVPHEPVQRSSAETVVPRTQPGEFVTVVSRPGKDGEQEVISAQQASVLTAIEEENRRRGEQMLHDAEWAEEKEREWALAKGIVGAAGEGLSSLDDSDDEVQDDEFEDGKDDGRGAKSLGHGRGGGTRVENRINRWASGGQSQLNGGIHEVGDDERAGAGVDEAGGRVRGVSIGSDAVEGVSRIIDGTSEGQVGSGGAKWAANKPRGRYYECAFCGEFWKDALALNEHCEKEHNFDE